MKISNASIIPMRDEPSLQRPRPAIPAAAIVHEATRAARGLSGPQQPRLYADLLDEADRLRQVAGDAYAQEKALRDPTP